MPASAPGRTGPAIPAWLARRRYRPRLKRQLADKLRAGGAPAPEAPPAAWTFLAGLGGNVVPLRRAPPSAVERR